MSKKLYVVIAIGLILASGLAWSTWRAERARETDDQEDLAEARAALQNEQVRMEELERQLADAQREGSELRTELRRELNELRLKFEDHPPQYRPQPRPHLDPSRDLPQR